MTAHVMQKAESCAWRAILRLAGFRTVEARNGSEALRLVLECAPVLILLDTRLPDLSGFEVCKLIKADPRTEDVLILQTSASFLNSADKIRALDGGADNYLVEPIEPDELIANVNALLRLRKVKQNLSESEMRFRQIAENSADVFWVFSPENNRPLYVSPAYDTLWQQDSARLADQPGDWIHAVHPEDRAGVVQAFTGFSHHEPFELTYRLLLKDGTVRWIRDRGYPVRDKAGIIYRVARISQDVSDRKLAEEVLTTASRRKDEFLATLAHELRNPLGPILHSVELLKADPSPQRLSECGAMIERHTRHLMRLVDDLLDISRVTQGKVTITRERIELKAFVSTALESVLPFLQSRDHSLSIELPDAPMYLNGDGVRLAQIVGNVLHNAGKYTPSGGRIVLKAERREQRVLIAISDNGIGITPENRTGIFEMFVQAQHASDRAQDGLGIGLSLVKTLTALHGGHIQVVSNGADQGSTFEIDLPLAVESGESGESAVMMLSENTVIAVVAEPQAGRNAGRILIVDDNRDSAEALSELLQLDGFQVDTAEDGFAALRYTEHTHPNIIFLDIGLPGMDGYELATKLRAMPATKHALLIALTGYGQAKDKLQAFQAGFDYHLVKPAELTQLRAILAAVSTVD
jgi:PAS domain S-box-containing protein